MTPTNQVFILAKEPLIRTTLRLLLETSSSFVLTGEAAFIDELSPTCTNDDSQILLYEMGGTKRFVIYLLTYAVMRPTQK